MITSSDSMTKFRFRVVCSLLLLASARISQSSAFCVSGIAKCRADASSLVSLSASSLAETFEETTASPQPAHKLRFSELTSMILDKTPHRLSEDLQESILPLLVWWGRKESAKGARTVESLLDQLEEQNLEMLDNKHYTVAIDAWGKAPVEDSTEGAERVFERMKTNDLNPSRATYNALMNAYSRKGKMDRVEEIMNYMEDAAGIDPITNDYNVLLSAYARTGMARKAEAVLKRMINKCVERDADSEPDLISYNNLIDAWAKSNESGRGERAEGILMALENKYESGELQYRPDARTYSSAICAVVRSNEKGSINRAEKLLAQAEEKGIVPDAYLYSALLDAYAIDQSPGSAERAEEMLHELERSGVANAVTYNTVLKAWKSSDDPNAPDRAEAILSRMQELGIADTISYSTTISVHAKKGGAAAAKRADEILKHMKSSGASANSQTVNSVINAWVRSGEMQQAEQILEDMEKSFYQGKGKIVPNVVSYTTVMNGWAKSKSAESAKKTKEWFQRMKSMYKSGNVAARPNGFSYVTLIGSLAKSDLQGAAAESEKMLFEMFDEHQRGNQDVKPNNQLVSTVLDAWQRSGDRDAGERAEALLTWLIDTYKRDQDESLQPNEFTFASAISAWAKSRKLGKATRARAILTRMIKLKEGGDIKSNPNTHCYTAVINSCAYAENDAIEKRDALQVAVETYKQHCASTHDRPNQITFFTMITALRNLLPASEKRTAALRTIFNQCIEEGQVAEFVLRRLQSCLTPNEFRDFVGTEAFDSGNIDMSKIPHEWRRNAGK